MEQKIKQKSEFHDALGKEREWNGMEDMTLPSSVPWI